MRKLKLQMQTSVNGFVASTSGKLDWMQWSWDDALKGYVNALTEPVDCIVMGRVLAEGLIPAWAGRVNDPESGAFARKMLDTPKVVFSRTLERSPWENTRVTKGELVQEIGQLKAAPGGDIIAYGGATFVSDLIRHGLIDELHFFVNPSALGAGMAIFRDPEQRVPLKLTNATPFECGIVVLTYAPKRAA